MFVELVFFRSKPDATTEEVLGSAQKIQDLALAMSSSFKIDLLRKDDGEWVEIVHWDSEEEAHRVEQAMMSNPEAQQAMAVMQEDSIRMMFLHPVT